MWYPDQTGHVMIDCAVQKHKQNSNLLGCNCLLDDSSVFAPAVKNKPNLQYASFLHVLFLSFNNNNNNNNNNIIIIILLHVVKQRLHGILSG